jgi:hypothetical protein
MPAVLAVVALLASVADVTDGQDRSAEDRQFDFWIGEWDVNLRVLQPDATWKDAHKATARIYSILGGKAILELWSEGRDGINGYSLRYFNHDKSAWDLWLNWAGRNRSGTSGLEGRFRNGRGEFFAEQKTPDGATRISRYTFSDIAGTSLRWDDGVSLDGGRTWASNWIMEFSRRADMPPAIGTGKNLHTYFDGTRCDFPEFDILKTIVASHRQETDLQLYNILDGCIVAGLVTAGPTNAFFTLTYNTYANLYELAFLDADRTSSLALYYGLRIEDRFDLKNRDGEPATIEIAADSTIRHLVLNYAGKQVQVDR